VVPNGPASITTLHDAVTGECEPGLESGYGARRFKPTRYDLVHSYCTQLLTAGGGDIALVAKARRHRDIRTTMVYTQVNVDPGLAIAVRKAFSAAK
jgi:integrase